MAHIKPPFRVRSGEVALSCPAGRCIYIRHALPVSAGGAERKLPRVSAQFADAVDVYGLSDWKLGLRILRLGTYFLVLGFKLQDDQGFQDYCP